MPVDLFDRGHYRAAFAHTQDLTQPAAPHTPKVAAVRHQLAVRRFWSQTGALRSRNRLFNPKSGIRPWDRPQGRNPKSERYNPAMETDTPYRTPLRLGVLLSGGGRTLENLLLRIERGELPAEVVVVIASRDCRGVEVGRRAGIGTHLVARKELKELREYSGRITALLDAARVDLVVMAGFLSMWLIPPQYEGKVVNIHPALLPSFGGQGMYGHHVHEAVLKAGCKVSGCTVHFVTNEYDRGPIIVQRCVPVIEGDTPDTLAARVFEQECEAFPEAIRLYAQGRLRIDGGVVRVG
jgi:formyltetrahydrofolate-dependent phosphoribosylglycinamide formyltransferase